MSWGVYLLAAFSLLGAFVPALNGVYSRSEVSAGITLLNSVVAVVDGLRPGVSVEFGYSAPSDESLVLSGYQVTLVTRWATLTGTSRWNLPDSTLVPGATYVLSLDESSVRVAQIG